MIRQAILVVLASLVAPAALADPLLKSSEIIRSMEGLWGSSVNEEKSCQRRPLRIWLEKDGVPYRYKAQWFEPDGRPHTQMSPIRVPPSVDGVEQTYIVVSNLVHPELGDLTRWTDISVSMPDRNTLVWQPTPTLPSVAPYVRCNVVVA